MSDTSYLQNVVLVYKVEWQGGIFFYIFFGDKKEKKTAAASKNLG